MDDNLLQTKWVGVETKNSSEKESALKKLRPMIIVVVVFVVFMIFTAWQSATDQTPGGNLGIGFMYAFGILGFIIATLSVMAYSVFKEYTVKNRWNKNRDIFFAIMIIAITLFLMLKIINSDLHTAFIRYFK